MKIERFLWTADNVSHIARHCCSPDEVEEVFDNRPLVLRTYNQRYLALGKSLEGRYLTVIFTLLHARRHARVITARDMHDKERRYYRRKRS